MGADNGRSNRGAVVASFRIDTDDFSQDFVTLKPLLPPGSASLQRIGAFSLGVEDVFGTVPIGQTGDRWESLRIDFGYGFPQTATGTDLPNIDINSDEYLFGNSSVSYTSGPVVDGVRQTDTGPRIAFSTRRLYAKAISPPAAVERK